MAKSTLYIAYGSNLNAGQMAHRCPDAEAVGTGVIRDYRLAFKALGANAFATIEACEGESVPVAVWRISHRDTTMRCGLDTDISSWMRRNLERHGRGRRRRMQSGTTR